MNPRLEVFLYWIVIVLLIIGTWLLLLKVERVVERRILELELKVDSTQVDIRNVREVQSRQDSILWEQGYYDDVEEENP